MKAVDALHELEELGSAQWGLVTTGQAVRADIDRVTLGRLADRGVLTRVRHGVYSLPSAELGPLQDLRSAWLGVNSKLTSDERINDADDAVVSHASAAVVHGLGDIIAAHHNFTSPIRRQSSQPDIRFHRAPVAEDKTLVNGLPVTSVARTIADLAMIPIDFDHLATIVRDGLDSTDLSADELSRKLEPHSDRYGFDSSSALIKACLNRAGLPHTVAQLLDHSPSTVVHVFAEQIETMFRPMMEKLLSEQLQAAFATADVTDQDRSDVRQAFYDTSGVASPEAGSLGVEANDERQSSEDKNV
jgi:hypothetical protein